VSPAAGYTFDGEPLACVECGYLLEECPCEPCPICGLHVDDCFCGEPMEDL